ncbi:MAG TPA: hypothetical protein VKH19_01745 [Gemmatimonadaceae bacterium]|nr:hypothetical protein [Gemmatimonadaceae bacterium]
MRLEPHVPGPSSLLRLWEDSLDAHPLDRSLAVLRAIYPAIDRGTIADRTAGERDALLLRARDAFFGPRIDATAVCPACGERNELTLDAAALTVAPNATTAETAPAAPPLVYVGTLAFRVPTSRDIAAAIDIDAAHMARAIARRCFAGEEPSPEISDELMLELNEQLTGADPQADVELALACDACGGSWTVPFDIGVLLWDELSACARTLLSEIDILARAYGWSEDEILALTDSRRARYVELAST